VFLVGGDVGQLGAVVHVQVVHGQGRAGPVRRRAGVRRPGHQRRQVRVGGGVVRAEALPAGVPVDVGDRQDGVLHRVRLADPHQAASYGPASEVSSERSEVRSAAI
jgi:hypothetical protein